MTKARRLKHESKPYGNTGQRLGRPRNPGQARQKQLDCFEMFCRSQLARVHRLTEREPCVALEPYKVFGWSSTQHDLIRVR